MNKYRILIIDDEPNILETMKDCFTMEGYEVLTAENGQDGIEEAKSAVPDLIIVDIMLPDSDGNEVCRIIKEDCGMKIPVIVATSKIDAIDATKARAAGADDFTVKTMDYEPLLDAVKKILG